MNTDFEIQRIIENLPMVNPERKYWLIRTDSGEYYEEFRDNNYIAINYNEISVFDLNRIRSDPKNKALKDGIKNKIKVAYSTEEKGEESVSRSRSIAIGQLLKFVHDIKKGDVVVIPSHHSDLFSFGEVLETPPFIANAGVCRFAKRKKVKWLKKDFSRSTIDAQLYAFIHAHQAINNIEDYKEGINRTLFDFYTINGKSTLILRLKKQGAINPFEIKELYDNLLFFIEEFSAYNNQKIDKESINVKFNLQSPGIIVFAGILVSALVLIGVFTALSGGENSTEFDPTTGKFKTSFKTNSFMDKLSDFLDRKQVRRERAVKLIKSLQHFEVAKNKELQGLTGSDPKKEENNSTDSIEDHGEV